MIEKEDEQNKSQRRRHLAEHIIILYLLLEIYET